MPDYTSKPSQSDQSDLLPVVQRFPRDLSRLFAGIESRGTLHAVWKGCELAGVCDLTIAAESARLGEIQIRHGFGIPMLITPYITGQKQAKEILLLGEMFTAEDALRMGMINRVVPDEELDEAANEMAHKLAALPPAVVRLNKRLVNLVYEQMGLVDAVRYRDNDAPRELLEANDTVGTGRQRIREEQGWAAFKRERDQG